MKRFLHPLRRHVLVVDEPGETLEGGVVRPRARMSDRLDFVVAAVGGEIPADYGVGDTVVLASPSPGHPVTIDGVRYRMVRADDVVAVVRTGETP